MMREPRGQALIDRYKKNYHINNDVKITEEMILAHWELEKQLTKEILESNPENRWKVFERCYSVLYNELWWLNQYVGTSSKIPPSCRYNNWVQQLAELPKRFMK